MTDRPFINTPTAILLREMNAGGMSWRTMAEQIGYARATLNNCATGRDRAGPALARDVAQMHARWAKVAA